MVAHGRASLRSTGTRSQRQSRAPNPDEEEDVSEKCDTALAAGLALAAVVLVEERTKPVKFYGYAKRWGEFTSFHISNFVVKDKAYASVEHYYQSMKFEGRPEEDEVREAPTSEEAKQLGRQYPLRLDWEEVKCHVLLTAFRAKFTQNDRLGDLLLSTGTRELHFDDPHDSFWGTATQKDGTQGKNVYGSLLMEVRGDLRQLLAGGSGWKRLGHFALMCAVRPASAAQGSGWSPNDKTFDGNRAAAVRAEATKLMRGHVDKQALILDERNLLALERGFDEMDEDKSGSLSIFELQSLWSAVFVELHQEEVQRITEHIWPDIDVDDDDEITFVELVNYLKGVASKGDNEIDYMLGVEETRERPTQCSEWVWAVVDQGAGERYALRWLRRSSVTWAMTMQFAILTSILVMIIESLPELTTDDGKHGNGTTEGIETVCIAVFTLEFLLRFVCCPSQKELWSGVFTYVDLLAVLPFYLQQGNLMGDQSSADSLSVLRALRFVRLVRVLRVIKLGRNAEGIQLMTVAMGRSRLALGWALVLIVMAVVLFSSLMFYCEKEDAVFTNYTIQEATIRAWVRRNDSSLPDAGLMIDFQSIPDAMWWALVTLTTTGFGDQYTRTDLGKTVASVTMGSGLLVLAYPVTVISTNFAEVQQEFDERRKKQRRREQFQRRLAEQKEREAAKERVKASGKVSPHAGTQPDRHHHRQSHADGRPLGRRESILTFTRRGSSMSARRRRRPPRVSVAQSVGDESDAQSDAHSMLDSPTGIDRMQSLELSPADRQQLQRQPQAMPQSPTSQQNPLSAGARRQQGRAASLPVLGGVPAHDDARSVPLEGVERQLVQLKDNVDGVASRLRDLLPAVRSASASAANQQKEQALTLQHLQQLQQQLQQLQQQQSPPQQSHPPPPQPQHVRTSPREHPVTPLQPGAGMQMQYQYMPQYMQPVPMQHYVPMMWQPVPAEGGGWVSPSMPAVLPPETPASAAPQMVVPSSFRVNGADSPGLHSFVRSQQQPPPAAEVAAPPGKKKRKRRPVSADARASK